jgi:hypothetical protein
MYSAGQCCNPKHAMHKKLFLFLSFRGFPTTLVCIASTLDMTYISKNSNLKRVAVYHSPKPSIFTFPNDSMLAITAAAGDITGITRARRMVEISLARARKADQTTSEIPQAATHILHTAIATRTRAAEPISGAAFLSTDTMSIKTRWEKLLPPPTAEEALSSLPRCCCCCCYYYCTIPSNDPVPVQVPIYVIQLGTVSGAFCHHLHHKQIVVRASSINADVAGGPDGSVVLLFVV